MNILVTLFLAILPSIIILSIVYNKDNEKEPIKLLLSLLGVGILCCFLTVLITFVILIFFPFLESGAVMKSGNLFLIFIYCFIEVGLIEEFSKWIFNISIGWNNKEFDHIYDAIVYSVFVSLGFATFENILYVGMYGVETAFLRAVLSVPAHAFFGVFMGYYIGLSKLTSYNNKKNLSKKYMTFSLLIPSLLHGLFDFCLLSQSLFLLLLFGVLVISLYVFGIKKIKQFSNIKTKFINEKKYCTNCGVIVTDKYCSNCGNKITY